VASYVSYTGEDVSLEPGNAVSVPASGVSLQVEVSFTGGVSVPASGQVPADTSAILLQSNAGLIELEDASGVILLE